MAGLQDQVITITGATGGIGRAVAVMAAREGARLAISGRDAAKVAQLEKELTSLGAPAVYAGVADMTREDQTASFFEKGRARLGRLDVLVNAPGLSVPGSIVDANVEDIRQMLDVNVLAMFLASKHFVPCAPPEGGLIVAIGSVAGKRANPTAPGYCAAKAAAAMLAQGMAMQLKDKKIRVTTLSPGAVDSPFWGSRAVPREKFMRVEDVAEVVRFVINTPKHVVIHEMTFEPFEMFK